MDWAALVELVKNFGFPVACVIAMFLMWQKEVQSHKEEMENMRKSIEEQNYATIAALNNNTVVLNKILLKIGEDNA